MEELREEVGVKEGFRRHLVDERTVDEESGCA